MPGAEFEVPAFGVENVAVVEGLGIDGQKEPGFFLGFSHDLDIAHVGRKRTRGDGFLLSGAATAHGIRLLKFLAELHVLPGLGGDGGSRTAGLAMN